VTSVVKVFDMAEEVVGRVTAPIGTAVVDTNVDGVCRRPKVRLISVTREIK